MTTGKKRYKRSAIESYKSDRRKKRAERLEKLIDEGYDLLDRIITGEQVQMYTIGGRSLQNYQLTPQAIKSMIEEWENELAEIMAAENGMASRRAFVVLSAD